MTHLETLEEHLNPLREDLLNHPIYNKIERIESIQVFMEHHVFAVWDFMSLLKTLQDRLCCVDVPWMDSTDPQACRFINEIVLAEESDEDGRGGYASHFELYYRSMKQCGASTTGIDAFLAELGQGHRVQSALASPVIPDAVVPFVDHTFKIIEDGDLCAIATAFTYGREDLLPGVFQRIVDELNVEAGGHLSDFKYYLERHIDLDGDEHGPMATRLIQSLCGSDDLLWKTVQQTATACLIARRRLWDGISEAISE